MGSKQEHWDTVFANSDDKQLGWYEGEATEMVKMLEKVPKWCEGRIFIAGVGTSVLADTFVSRGSRLVLNDISSQALEKLKSRLGSLHNDIVWNCQDISKPLYGLEKEIDLWIDRATLHFLIETEEVEGYFKNVHSVLKEGGHVLFAEFSHKGATQCAGLPVKRYSIEELAELLGDSYSLLEDFEYTYINPSGSPRPYIYALFEKKR